MNRKPRIATQAEAAALRCRGIDHRTAFGTLGLMFPAAGADDDPLLKQVRQIDGELKDLREDAGEKWKALEEVKAKVGEATEPIEQGSDLYKELEQTGKDYGEVSDKIADREGAKTGLIAVMAQAGITPPADVKGIERDPGIERRNGHEVIDPGKRIVEGEAWRALKDSGELESAGDLGGRKRLGEAYTRDEVKALISGGDPSSAGAFTVPQQVGYFSLPLRPLTILDLITVGQTDSDLIEYVRMLTNTNAAAETPEAISAATIGDGTGGTVTPVQGGRKPESGMTFERVQEGVSAIAHWVPATKKSVADAGQLRTIIDGVLRWGLGDRVERQVVAGNGVGDNLLGLLETTGTNSVAAGPDPHADKISHGMVAIRLDGYEPTGVALNPLDAETIRLERTNEGGAGTGTYLYGGPMQPGPRTLWGLPIAEAPSIPQGTALVGAFNAAILWLREGAQVIATDSHEDFFVRNLIAILAELRAGFGVPTPQAFAEANLAAA